MFKISKKIIISGAIGNALEMYDYTIWGLFSAYLANEFLPPQSKLSDIFFIFLTTYFLRPLGSLIFGILSDQLGRKKILTLCIGLMGLCTSVIGLLPSYQHIGTIAFVTLLGMRLIQVFSIGVEYIGSISLLIESCDKHRRGYFGSWAAFGINSGILVTSLIGGTILCCIEAGLLPKWGWRIAFIMSVITMWIGFWIRYSIPESFEFVMQHARQEKRSMQAIFIETLHTIQSNLLESLVVFTLVWFGVSTTILVFIYAPIHMTTFNHLVNYQPFIINACSLTLLVMLIPIFGAISDKYGRINSIVLAIIALLVLIIPYFLLLSRSGFYTILLFHTVIGIPCACLFSVIPVFITELFDLSIRCTSTGFIYSLASSIGGGITPLLALKLAHSSYGVYSPSYWLISNACLSLLVLLVLSIKKRSTVNNLQLVSSNISNFV